MPNSFQSFVAGARWLTSLKGVRPVAGTLALILAGQVAGPIQAPGTANASHAEADRRAELESKAISLAASLQAVPVSEGGAQCPTTQLAVSYTDPGDRHEHGAHITPVGPAPTLQTLAVNGIVVCGNKTHAYMGFEAYWNGTDWIVADVPAFSDDHDKAHEVELATVPAAPPAPVPAPPAAPPAPAAVPADPSGLPGFSGSGIDGYAPYEPQRRCDPTAKPGVLAFRNMVLAKFPHTGNSGISRGCSVGGTSEHKEGRAWDWRANINVASERAAVDATINWLMATDAQGNKHAMARRTGVMYVIWNRKIWTSYRANDGWRAYSGPSSHTDHVHISFSWAGALGKTSFWSGVPMDTSFAPPNATPAGNSAGTKSSGTAGTSTKRQRTTSPTVDAAEKARRAEEKQRIRQEHAAHEAARKAEKQRLRDERAAEEAARKAEKQRLRDERAAEEAARQAEKQRLREERAALEAARQAEKQAKREAEEAARKAREEERRARKSGSTTTVPKSTTTKPPPTTAPPTTAAAPPPPPPQPSATIARASQPPATARAPRPTQPPATRAPRPTRPPTTRAPRPPKPVTTRAPRAPRGGRRGGGGGGSSSSTAAPTPAPVPAPAPAPVPAPAG